MVQNNADTIVAEATPKGRGGVGVVRISGPETANIAEKILTLVPKIRSAEYLPFLSEKGEVLDYGVAVFFKAPHSFTGEDVLELQGHGSPVIMESLVQTAIQAGARLAAPGEFSLRAYLNNKMDLPQAEAVADLINATSKQAAQGALRSLQGVFSRSIEAIIQGLIQLRMFVEAAIDFPEEEIDFLEDNRIVAMIQNLKKQIKEVQQQAEQGVLLSQGLRMVIAGLPNAGKSSLLNKLSGQERAIVTNIPGTTRDVLREQILIDGLMIELVDTAGLRVGAEVIEQEGIKRALAEITLADHVIWVVDGTTLKKPEDLTFLTEWLAQFPKEIGVTVLYNKIDKLGIPAAVEEKEGFTVVSVSLKTGEGETLFRDHLKKMAGLSEGSEGNFTARRRHLDALSQAMQHVVEGERQLLNHKAGELLAEELLLAQRALDEITGKVTSDDLLGKIFSEFCIGK